jgi:hypothetical protein
MKLSFKQYLEEATSWDNIRRAHPQNVRDRIYAKQEQGNNIPIGSGANAAVYAKDDPHSLDSVQRVSSKEKRRDLGYHTYAQFLLKYPGLKKNPYLPRIHSVEHDDDNSVVEYEIERLHPFDDPKISHPDMLWAICNKMFTPQQVKWMKEDVDLEPTQRDPREEHVVLRRAIAEVIAMCIPGGNLDDTIKDPQLKQAINVVRAVLRHNRGSGVYTDIHSDNIMWRMTGTMPQLVITDPLYQSN